MTSRIQSTVSEGAMTLHGLIEQQVARAPAAEAVWCGGEVLSYEALNRRANQCAHYLRELGVGPDVPVAVMMERSVEMVVALLAILKAGGAYLPLNPRDPKERLQFVLGQAGAAAVLTRRGDARALEGLDVTCLALDEEREWLNAQPEGNLAVGAGARDLAYIIYTSGSTGKPKGCMIEHRAICNRLLWMRDEYGVGPNDRVLQKTPYTFDVSVWEFFLPLLSGACLVVAKPGGHQDNRYLAELIRSEGVTLCHFVPSMLRFFLREPGVERCGTLRHVFVSGEALPQELMREFLARMPAPLHNLYGPTEAAVDVTYWRCRERADRKVPIGRAIANVQCRVLDEQRKEVPAGAEGELYIGGIGVGRGYLNQPELTRERFVADPFAGDPAARMYRTGDKARVLPDGEIEFLGRIDFQVKVRGFRIELGEIEETLRQHEAIDDAAVVVVNAESEDPKLAAYLVTKGRALSSKEVRAWVKSKLPEYMVPNVVTLVDALPTSGHGKLDRVALGRMGAGGGEEAEVAEVEGASDEPSAVEIAAVAAIAEELRAYFARVLGVATVADGDDLFDLGATSFTMVQAVGHIQATRGVRVPAEVFLDNPTIGGIARHVAAVVGGERSRAASEEKRTSLKHPEEQRATVAIELPAANFGVEAHGRAATGQVITGRVALRELGRLLSVLRRREGNDGPNYLYSSAGGLRAVQTYLQVAAGGVEGLEAGFYYYHPQEHRLYVVGGGAVTTAGAFAVLFVAEMRAIGPIYGNAAPSLVAVEAGYMAQALIEQQADAGVTLCPAPGFDEKGVQVGCGLEEGQVFLHAVVGGAVGESASPRGGGTAPPGQRGAGMAGFLESAADGEEFPSEEENARLHREARHLRRFGADARWVALEAWEPTGAYYRLRAAKRVYRERPIARERFGEFLTLAALRAKRERLEGRAYPVRLYVYLRREAVEGIAEGLYRYESDGHRLVRVAEKLSVELKACCTPFNRRHVQEAKFCGFLVSDVAAVEARLGAESLYYCHVEAGHVGQLLLNRQAEFGLGICPIGGLRFEKIRGDFGIGEREVFLHGFVGGDVDVTEEIPWRTLKGRRATVEAKGRKIAIVGMSGRFPGAANVRELAENLRAGRSSFREVRFGEAMRCRESGDAAGAADAGAQRHWGGFVEDVDCFDAGLFQITPAEARTMDPQERLFLETAWECLEDAGYTGQALNEAARRVGVFVGAMWDDYQHHDEAARRAGEAGEPISSHTSSIANRVSFFFDFKGPSVAVNTSCSSAMTALHQACQSLLAGECRAAVAGGVNVMSHPYHHDVLAGAEILSADGVSRPFGSGANGWVAGEGVGAVLLKRLEEAERDGDTIHAVILGTTVSHSGRTARYGAPTTEWQAESMRAALEQAGVAPAAISYVEAAAPGAGMADAAEAAAIRAVFGGDGEGTRRVWVGSIKANVGHLESASGVSQLAKVVQQMKAREIFPTVGFAPMNPMIAWEGTGLAVPGEVVAWEVGGGTAGARRRALLNAFGATGSAGHVVLEEHVATARPEGVEGRAGDGDGETLVVLSAATVEQLREGARRLYGFLDTPEGAALRLADVGYTLRVGRVAMRERRAAVVRSREELRAWLVALAGGHSLTLAATAEENRHEGGESRRLAARWVRGEVALGKLAGDAGCRRVSLPTYAFAKERHWVGAARAERGGVVGEGAGEVELRAKLLGYLTDVFAEVTEVRREQVEATARFEDYGITSLMIRRINERLKAEFGEMSAALLFEYPTIGDVAEHLLARHGAAVTRKFAAGSTPRAVAAASRVDRDASVVRRAESGAQAGKIAIVGVSGRYPRAADVFAFWENLRNGVDCISEVPRERWDVARFADGEDAPSRWGGFIEGVDEFDPFFFRISPKEAEEMDPQERLFLQTVWHLFEDAGYVPAEFGRAVGRRVGVFVGVMYGEYQLFSDWAAPAARRVVVDALRGSIANRISYAFDFQGPSMAVDTLCSSSLTALHLAVQSIQAGDCAAAVVGGVNLSIHPNKYLLQARSAMSASDGRCRSFGAGGDGFVPGEGVGAVLLKPLEAARRDGDQIYGVIDATAVNHDGRTHGYTVPNPNAQADMIAEALRKAGVPARAISYVEAHGTGTALGDPVEVAGLTKAFGASGTAAEERFCALGSVKSNIGHLEAAAGVAGLTKILLQMRHGLLVPSLHARELNPELRLEQTPFFVQQTLAEWRRPEGGAGAGVRRACLSSFGAGGANAHAIVAEAEDGARETEGGEARAEEERAPRLIVLSAKDEERLREVVARLHAFTAGEPRCRLVDLAWTLQVGREAMEARVAFLAESWGELRARLGDVLEGKGSAQAEIYRGQVARRAGAGADAMISDEDLRGVSRIWIEKGKFGRVLEAWVNGMEIEWGRLYGEERPRRVSLPGYPFAREKYWVPRRGLEEVSVDAGAGANADGNAWLHPLVERNVSDLRRVAFASTFSGEEFFLREHRLGGERVLPAAACLEMVRAAVELAAGDAAKGKSIRLRHVAWARRFSCEEGMRTLRVEIERAEGGGVKFEVVAERDGERVAISVGGATFEAPGEEAVVDVKGLRGRLPEVAGGAAGFYATFRAAGLEHGTAFRALEAVWSDGEVGLAKLQLPETARAEAARFQLHPALLDAAFQATVALGGAGAGAVGIPYALDELEVCGPLLEETWVCIRSTGTGEKLDLELCDRGGAMKARVRGFSTRPIEAKRSGAGMEFQAYRPVMTSRPLAVTAGAARTWARRVVLACGFEAMAMPGAECEALPLGAGDAAERFETVGVRVFERVQEMLRGQTRGDVLLQVAVRRVDAWLGEGLVGLLRTARRENPRFFGQVVEVEGDVGMIAERLGAESRGAVEAQVRYRGGERRVVEWEACGDWGEKTGGAPWRKGGVYLISGGAGGLGVIFAEEILRATGGEATVVLVGRSALAVDKERRLRALADARGAVVYRRVDVTRREAVEELVRGIVREQGALHGVVHAAGVLRDGFILRKTTEDFRAVLAPKVRGAVLLDEATRSLRLEVFVVFSSTVAVFGNVGQADYAAANGFLDVFARRRDEQVKAGHRHGRTLAINWPLWAEGGMRAGAEQAAGALPTVRGVRALAEAWGVGAPQVMIEEARALRVEAEAMAGASERAMTEATGAVGADVGAAMRQYLRELLAATIKAPVARVKDDEPFEAYGIDSVMVMKMTEELEKRFGSLSKTLFFEYLTVGALAEYFLAEKGEGVGRMFKGEAVGGSVGGHRPPLQVAERTRSRALDVAVIGLAGRYPAADDLVGFWKNLREGRDCITEIPRERWAWREYYDAERMRRGAHHSKWGGFIKDVDKFDPLFFNIAPNDAALLDPQERLFLETTWAALEDAGCRPEDLRGGDGRYLPAQVGVYAGVMYSEYQLLAHERTLAGNPTAAGSIYASIANRVSFFLDLHGPSVAVDTMCSSSLTCLHLACQDLHAGVTDLAIAGGVNVTIHPNKYLLLSEGQFISTAGHCGSFGEGGDGYIPGEGVGVAILKRLADAVRDGDQIYGVIKGSAVNHGGKTNGFSVPNPNAQRAVVAQALDLAGIDPARVTYIEAHGTGTKLGDPIEIAGLKRVFGGRATEAGRCWLGSVKSNIGHGEAAAGIAGLTKVLLQMRHGELVPSLHSAVLNPHLGLEGTPFEVNQTVRAWERQVVDGVALPRVAGISGFGAGGSNAHVVVEEFLSVESRGESVGPLAIVLSAKDERGLRERARQLAEWVRERPEVRLTDIGYTLQVGRQGMEVRAGFVAATREEAIAGLESVARGGEVPMRRGGAREGDGELGEAVTRWVAGESVDWRAVRRTAGRKISLPTYPFSRDSYWLGAPARLAGAVGPESEWLIVGETWETRPLPSEIDWQACLRRQAGRRVLVVAATAGEAEDLSARVRQLDVAAGVGMERALVVETVAFAEVAAWTAARAPEVVLVVGGGGAEREALRVIFELSQKLMREAWEAAVRLYVAYDGAEAALEWQALSGFLRSAMVENPRHAWTCVGSFEAAGREAVHHALLREWLADDAAAEEFSEVRYQGEERLVHRLEERADGGSAGRALFREGATYLVTGGVGPVGALLCRELAWRYRARLVILSRGELDEAKRVVVRELEALGARVFYYAVDVGERAALERTMGRVKAEAGPLHGVIHLARLVEDGLVLAKTWESVERVLRAKVEGTRHLDALTAGEPLEFFLLFSSMAAFGMHGASDYGYAAAFQNAFARERARRQAAGERSGQTLAVAWGPWNVDTYQPAQRDVRMREAGFELIGIERAFAWLERAGEVGQGMVGAMLVRDGERVRAGLGLGEAGGSLGPRGEGTALLYNAIPEPLAARIAGWELRKQQGQAVAAAEVSEFIRADEVGQLTDEWVERLHALLTGENGAAPGRNGGGDFAATIAQCLAEIIGVREVDPNKAFMDYGLDSVSGTRFALLIEKRLHVKVPPPVVIDHPTVRRLAAHLAEAAATAAEQGLN